MAWSRLSCIGIVYDSAPAPLYKRVTNLLVDEQRWQLAGSAEATTEQEKKAQGMFVQKIVDNLQVRLEHLKREGHFPRPSLPNSLR
jgi:hypothetical protein